MKLAVLGTGMVGTTLGAAFAAAGHEVTLGTRDPEATAARGAITLPLATFAGAAAGAAVVVLAVGGGVAESVLAAAGDLTGKVILDVTNPLDFSNGFPPSLTVKDTDSLAEVLQRAHPEAQVVKSLNTVNASLMVNPSGLGDGDTTIFLAGDEAAARDVVRGLLDDLGWSDIVEFEALEAARGLEMWLPLWVRLMQNFGTAQFNLKLVR
ncbi:NADPH-dependent F420 reductase [Nocardioides cavernaquae]|uniref:NADP oxidoreductase n=1 Tax=Nocardioides cavernaquae TaxID=2321396 RepID=A0A3A5H7H3_9ACTN|nr:NAD(P)-binding domain-containing protein [Nocardioides cavernaquae]RJS45951.1 NADP oxidoreductase [Nocardioides cavernaquae]